MPVQLHLTRELADRYGLEIEEVLDGDEGTERPDDAVVATAKPAWSEWRICDECGGEGRSSAYLGAFTAEDMDREGDEFFENYMAGRYDRTCEPCDGTGKVLALRVESVPSDVRAAVEQREAEELAYRREQEMERRMGA